jgi:acyl-CoA reductase-like NAD-dependent aldehyde dehydrogenase
MNGAPITVDNYINGAFVPPSTSQYLDVLNPSNSQVIGEVGLSSADDVDQAVEAAHQAQQAWAINTTIKQRAALMLKFHALIEKHTHELAALIVKENGKNMTEALADVAKGNETVEWSCSLPQLAPGRNLQVSGQVYCQDRREPLGVVASVVPFNFVSILDGDHGYDARLSSHFVSPFHWNGLLIHSSLVWFRFGLLRSP